MTLYILLQIFVVILAISGFCSTAVIKPWRSVQKAESIPEEKAYTIVAAKPILLEQPHDDTVTGSFLQPETPAPPVLVNHIPEPFPQSEQNPLVCEGNKYWISPEYLGLYECCGDTLYYWPNQRCSSSIAVNSELPPHSQQTSITCDDTKYYVEMEFVHEYGCCGSSLYQPALTPCVREKKKYSLIPLTDKSQKTFTLSEKDKNNCPSGYICCPDYSPIRQNSDNSLKCCPEVGPYDPNVNLCVTD